MDLECKIRGPHVKEICIDFKLPRLLSAAKVPLSSATICVHLSCITSVQGQKLWNHRRFVCPDG